MHDLCDVAKCDSSTIPKRSISIHKTPRFTSINISKRYSDMTAWCDLNLIEHTVKSCNNKGYNAIDGLN